MIPEAGRDSYFEMIGFPARVVAETGLIFMADRKAQMGGDATAGGAEIDRLRKDLEGQVAKFNTRIAGGKWNLMMPSLETKTVFPGAYTTQVWWPWYEKAGATSRHPANEPALKWVDAAKADVPQGRGPARWTPVAGLGTTGEAMALEPAREDLTWNAGDKTAPRLEYRFLAKTGDSQAYIDILPVFRLYPGRVLRVGVSVDDGPVTTIEVPGSNGKEDERGNTRRNGVQDNYVRLSVPLPGLTAGGHVLKILAVDPGAVIDRLSLPQGD